MLPRVQPARRPRRRRVYFPHRRRPQRRDRHVLLLDLLRRFRGRRPPARRVQERVRADDGAWRAQAGVAGVRAAACTRGCALVHALSRVHLVPMCACSHGRGCGRSISPPCARRRPPTSCHDDRGRSIGKRPRSGYAPPRPSRTQLVRISGVGDRISGEATRCVRYGRIDRWHGRPWRPAFCSGLPEQLGQSRSRPRCDGRWRRL